jgi:hypothetical protein
MMIKLIAVLVLACGQAYAAQWEEGLSVKDILQTAAANSQGMATAAGQPQNPELYAYAHPPLGFTSKTLQGTLALKPGVNVILDNVKGGSIRLADGPIAVVYGKPGVVDFLTRDRSVSLNQEGLTAALPARSNEFRSFGDFTTSPASDEKIMLKGSQVVTEERQYQREATDSCSYSGFCYAYGMKSDGEFGYSFGFHVSCSGHHKVIEQVTDYKRVQTIYLLSLPDKKGLGAITGPQERYTRARTIKTLTSCS